MTEQEADDQGELICTCTQVRHIYSNYRRSAVSTATFCCDDPFPHVMEILEEISTSLICAPSVNKGVSLKQYM